MKTLETPITSQILALLAPGDEVRDPDGAMWRVTKVEYGRNLKPRVTLERIVDVADVDAEFRPPGVTHSAPLGRRSFLLCPPLRVSLNGLLAKRFPVSFVS